MSDEILPNQVTENTPPSTVNQEELRKQRQILYGIILVGVIVIILIGLIFYGLTRPTVDTAKLRDIFIIFMAAETFMIGLVLIVLMVQLARLINLLQNEIKPIINSTNETVNTLRGTTVFLSNSLVEPVMKLNEYMAAFQQMLKLVGLSKKPK